MKLNKALLTVIFGGLVLVSCNNPTKSSDVKDEGPSIESLTINPEAEKQLLFLRLTDELKTDSSMIYTARAKFNEDTVGFKVEVLNHIKPGLLSSGKVNEEQGFVDGAIRISSIGDESDNFVKALGAIFKLPTDNKMTTEVILPTVFSSSKERVDLSKKTGFSFKLFFENKQGEPAELFLTLDTYRRAFELTEKDSSFRKQFISAFEGK